MILFNKNIPMFSEIVIVNGISNSQTKGFEKYLEGSDYLEAVKSITRLEAYVETSY